jgi:uncharacterized membrane protein YeiH
MGMATANLLSEADPDQQNMEVPVIYALDLFGSAVFAISGALVAGRKSMDLFGVCVLALVTAVGGGTLRDLLLGDIPVFWIKDHNYVYVALLAALGAFFFVRFIQKRNKALLLADALGLSVFTVIGADKALAMGGEALIAVIMGVMTGVVGGMIRDVLSDEIPLILRAEIYATAAMAGACVFVILRGISVDHATAASVAIPLTLFLRLAAIRWKLSLPLLSLTSEKQDTE